MTFLLCCSLIALSSTLQQQVRATTFSATNNATDTKGGSRFTTEIGLNYTLQIMNTSSDFIWKTFNQTTLNDRRAVQEVAFFIKSVDGVAFTVVDSSEIYVNSEYLGNYSGGDVKFEFTGIMYHEMTHVWQWFGNGSSPVGVTEGIADYVRLKAGLAPPHWRGLGQGDRWDQGYDVTALFLDYCEGLSNGFVAALNRKIGNGYDEGFFVEMLGKTVDELWSDYKAMYGH